MKPRQVHKLGRLGALACSLALVGAACGSGGSSSTPAPSSAGGGTAATEAKPSPGSAVTTPTTVAAVTTTEAPGRPGGTLTVGYVGTVNGLTPNPFGASTYPFRDELFDPLVALDAKGEPVPALAESWELADDGLTLTLHLRSGVTFHDGTAFDATAAVANIDWFKDPATGLQGGTSWAKVTAAAVDPSTVQLTFTEKVPEIFYLMSVAMVAKPGALDTGIGTGPFVLDSFTPRGGMKMSANPKYWGEKPKLDALEMREFADTTAAALSAQSGDIDLLLGVAIEQVDSLRKAGLTILENPAPGNLDLIVNTTDKGIVDARVRRALSLAFDRERFVETVLQGHGTIESSIFPPGSPVRHAIASSVTPFDLDTAKSLLDEAGVSNLSIDIMSPPVLATDQFLPIYQADLASIGVTLNIKPADAATWAQAVSQPGAIPTMATHRYSFGDGDPSLLFITQVFRPDANASGYTSPEYSAMVAAAAAESDPTARLEAYAAIDDFVADEAFVIPIANPSTPIAYQGFVRGFASNGQVIDFTDVTLAK